MKPVVTWVVVADGTQARVFENAGPGKGLHPVDGLRLEIEPLQASEIMADKPGRSFSSVGSGRSAMEYTSDPVEVPFSSMVSVPPSAGSAPPPAALPEGETVPVQDASASTPARAVEATAPRAERRRERR